MYYVYASQFNISQYVISLRITHDGSMPEMRIFSILLTLTDFKMV